MDRHRLSSSELIATAGGLLLIISLFLPWYGTESSNLPNIDGEPGTFSCWDVHPILRWLLLLAAARARSSSPTSSSAGTSCPGRAAS